MWDDASPRWKNTSLVVVQGKPVAYRYLHEYYSNFKSGRKIWDGLKHNWHKWKALAEEYGSLTDGQFWTKWSQNGRRLPVTAIIDALRRAKSEDEAKCAQAARAEYEGKRFEQHFSYLKCGIPMVMTKNSAIAKRYKQLVQLKNC
ncbi:hypothetical protein BDZ97DRAFT_1673772 [Flammula alnicola]|nr:hypothetical protein BDZ97DRAFT_1673772 [Flammula alnicola]